ncbi:hypothetical protein QYF61_000085 [Mycteria americana]|uniref:Uncharacterized protein n=1 Tax=Mycteria americana TaxID=33587 RepID=A0AAN7P016_MYCAM|nr:hypothetical protein QYF61_000085 [Mycteria americana]
MLAGPDPLVILYMACDSTQDDLLHQLPRHRGQADRPVVRRVLLPALLEETIEEIELEDQLNQLEDQLNLNINLKKLPTLIRKKRRYWEKLPRDIYHHDFYLYAHPAAVFLDCTCKSQRAKQPQFPQPLLTRLVLQTLHQLRCPSLDSLQHLNVSLVVSGPKLNKVFELNVHVYKDKQRSAQRDGEKMSPISFSEVDDSDRGTGVEMKFVRYTLRSDCKRLRVPCTAISLVSWMRVLPAETCTVTVFIPSTAKMYEMLLSKVMRGCKSLPDICWKYNTAERKQPRRFLECVEDKFLTQLVSEPIREGTPLDLLFVNREGLVGDVTVGGCLGHSDHKMIEFLILGEVRRGFSRTATLDFGRADSDLFRRLVDRVPWEAVLKGKGAQEGWTFFKKEILKAQEQAIPMCQKMSRKTSCSPGTQPPVLEDRDGEQNEAPIIQGEMVSDLLHHLDTHKSMGRMGSTQEY